MYVKDIELKNFGQFDEAKFNFVYPGINVIIANNGYGKSTILDSLAVVLGTWLLGIKGVDSRHIRDNEVRKNFKTFKPSYPVFINANCKIYEKDYSIFREKKDIRSKTTYIKAKNVKELAEKTLKNNSRHLPVIAYYGTGRRWLEPKESKDKKFIETSRIDGYKYSVDPRVNIKLFTQWFQKNVENPKIKIIKNALINCLENCKDLFFDYKHDMLMIQFIDKVVPFNYLSDGQKTLLAMVADITFKMITLNPRYKDDDSIKKTTGCILIDEIDLHLHPKWQRDVLNNLTSTFPKLQFIVTTHSPFIIQSIGNSGNLIQLNNDEKKNYINLSIEEIAEELMNIKLPQRSKKFVEMFNTALEYYKLLDESKEHNANKEKISQIKERLNFLMVPYSNNPAHGAYYHYLESKKISSNIGD